MVYKFEHVRPDSVKKTFWDSGSHIRAVRRAYEWPLEPRYPGRRWKFREDCACCYCSALVVSRCVGFVSERPAPSAPIHAPPLFVDCPLHTIEFRTHNLSTNISSLPNPSLSVRLIVRLVLNIINLKASITAASLLPSRRSFPFPSLLSQQKTPWLGIFANLHSLFGLRHNCRRFRGCRSHQS